MPSGSEKNAMCQTPVSKMSPAKSTPLALSFGTGGGDIVGPKRVRVALLGDERHAKLLGLPDAGARVASPLLIVSALVGAKAKGVAVEATGAAGVLRGYAEEVKSCDRG